MVRALCGAGIAAGCIDARASHGNDGKNHLILIAAAFTGVLL
jgi:hypothetical protein